MLHGFKLLKNEKPKTQAMCILLARYSDKREDYFEQSMGSWNGFKQAFINNDGEVLPTPELWKECDDFNGISCDEFYSDEFDEKERYKSCRA